MATKKQRMALRTSGGEPVLSLSSFAATMPAAFSPAAAGSCASVPESYLVYCYLCRTGLWREITPRLAPCGALYLACEPEVHPVGGQQRKAPAAAPPAAAAEGAAAPAPVGEDVEMAEKEDDDEVSSSSGMDDDDEVAGNPTGAAAGAAASCDAAAAAADAAAASAPALPAAPPPPAEAAEPEGHTFRDRTMMVPISVANVAPTPDRLHQLLRISDAEDGAAVSLALVDSDGTVIVTYASLGLVPPEVLQGAESDDEDDGAGMMATVLPDDDQGAAAGAAADAS